MAAQSGQKHRVCSVFRIEMAGLQRQLICPAGVAKCMGVFEHYVTSLKADVTVAFVILSLLFGSRSSQAVLALEKAQASQARSCTAYEVRSPGAYQPLLRAAQQWLADSPVAGRK